MHAPHSAFAQFEKDERGHAAESFVNHCCCTVPLNKLKFHARQYICSDFISLEFFRTSRVVVRAFHRAMRRVFPRLLPCVSLTNVLLLSNFYLFFIPLLFARSPATTTAAVVQSLTTDSPVTQLNFHIFRLCMLHAPICTLCVLSHSP